MPIGMKGNMRKSQEETLREMLYTGEKIWGKDKDKIVIPEAASQETRKRKKRPSDEPTLKCQRNPFIGALGIQEPVMPGEPLIEC